jgi:hypothetical protein
MEFDNVYGSGVFQSDSAAMFLCGQLITPLHNWIESIDHDPSVAMPGQSGDAVIAAVATIAILAENGFRCPLAKERIMEFRDKYMETWNGYIHENVHVDPQFVKDRRKIMDSIFDRLIRTFD